MNSSKSTIALRRMIVALSPLALCLLIAWLVMAGLLGFGGGEKDILLVLPPTLWSFVFAVASLAMWASGASQAKANRISALIAFAALALAFALLLALTWK